VDGDSFLFFSPFSWERAGRDGDGHRDGDLKNSRARGSQAIAIAWGCRVFLLHFGRSRRLGSVRDQTRDPYRSRKVSRLFRSDLGHAVVE
jgi:hypothetical protein